MFPLQHRIWWKPSLTVGLTASPVHLWTSHVTSLSDKFHFARVNDESHMCTKVINGVLQDSDLGPVLSSLLVQAQLVLS